MNGSDTSGPLLAAALTAAAARNAQQLREVTDPAAPAPGLDWTVAEVAAHLVADLREYTDVIAGHGPEPALPPGRAATATAAELTAADNRRQLAGHAERDPGRLAAELSEAVPAFIAAAAPAGTPVSTPFGMAVRPATIAAIVLGEQLIHGLDIARATGQPWPITAGDARLVIPGLMDVLPGYINRDRARGLHARYELRFGADLRYQLAIDDGAGAVGPASGRPDCVITADPVAFLLVGYGRISQRGPILRGKLRSGGRKPWLGFRFGGLTVNP
ncbi:MAG TPA: maleylpyruvate isomerase family mycothiol-dependent enzyme [Streptosporangiaceae bacterium]